MARIVSGVDLVYKISKINDAWQIVALGEGWEIPLPFAYQSREEALRELEKLGKEAIADEGT